MTARFPRWLATGAVSILLAGCPLPPPPASDDVRSQALPNLMPAEKWTAGPTDPGPVAPGWLALFREPELEKLVAEAMLYNVDLKVAAARVDQVRGVVKPGPDGGKPTAIDEWAAAFQDKVQQIDAQRCRPAS